ncbi:MAG: tRNA preQ1(34) S-adenosylmethionine ribosyltransferase-isomerase QueA [SAR324 cluster bacterium]|nr:tRNA preQ1(34) S-adenosylmethionine ribosyltransferase-isomerase QueA [SAR324 cluster bacterium]
MSRRTPSESDAAMPYLLRQFDYHLPESLIAQQPLERRDRSRLMLLRLGGASISHHEFQALPELLPEGTVLVLNNTRVLPRRLLGRLPGGATVEALLLDEEEPGLWKAAVKKARRIKPGMRVVFGQGQLPAEAVRRGEDGEWLLRFDNPETVPERLERRGLAPLPPYIRRNEECATQDLLDRGAYQTCYASMPGAIAAPTAGLHFSPQVLDSLRHRAVELVELTLHVGQGTFAPVKTENVREHRLHREWYELAEPAAHRILQAKDEGRPVIAVGTTSVRALESWAQAGSPPGYQGWSELFILPPYQFRIVDGMLTNFHQPRSSLLMLVAAFYGLQPLLRAYGEAVAAGYRFFSYGDCMAILPLPE